MKKNQRKEKNKTIIILVNHRFYVLDYMNMSKSGEFNL